MAGFKTTVKPEHLEELKGKADFVDAVSKAIGWNCGSVTDVHYVAYQEEGSDEPYEFILVIYRGGGYAVRNVHMNSHSAILRDIAKLTDGGYYDEVEGYEKLVKDPKIHKIVG